MKTREINIKRHQVTIDGFSMPLDELIRKLEQVKKLAKDSASESEPLIGFPESMFSIFSESSLIVQWDQVVPDEKPEEASDA